METIETMLKKATQIGGFQLLSKDESSVLVNLSKVIEAYEDSVLKLMPILKRKS